MAVAPKFRALQAPEVVQNFEALCRHVAADQGRVEIVSADGSCACVLMSKSELDCLENALEILADSEAGRALAEDVLQLTHVAQTGSATV